jgi:hypothetical protein
MADLPAIIALMTSELDILKDASLRLSNGNFHASVEARASALGLQRLCASARYVALMKGRDLKEA